MKPDIVGVIEAAYQVEQDESAWLRSVMETAAPSLDHGLGCDAFFYDARDVNAFRIHGFISQEGPGGDDGLARAIERSAPERIRWVFRTQACRLASEGPDWVNQPAAKIFRARGIEDVLFVNGLDPGGLGCFLTAKLSARGLATPGVRRRWARVAAHLAAGYRLRRRVEALAQTKQGTPAAILTPDGKLEHADAEAAQRQARTALRDAVTAIERARGRLRRDEPDTAVEQWKGLVAATWSLVDRFERDGKRYVIACQNQTTGARPVALTSRERQVVACARLGHTNKFIAYELGIAASTVAVLLFRASRKLGATSRAELFEAFDRASASDGEPG